MNADQRGFEFDFKFWKNLDLIRVIRVHPRQKTIRPLMQAIPTKNL